MLIVAGALLMMLCVEIFNRKSIWGKAVVATSNDHRRRRPDGHQHQADHHPVLLDQRHDGGLRGVLVAPVTLTGATMGAVLALKAFAVAIIGGLESGLGVIVGGLILGVAETLTGFYISTGYKDVPGLILLLVVLSIRPVGLFARP